MLTGWEVIKIYGLFKSVTATASTPATSSIFFLAQGQNDFQTGFCCYLSEYKMFSIWLWSTQKMSRGTAGMTFYALHSFELCFFGILTGRFLSSSIDFQCNCVLNAAHLEDKTATAVHYWFSTF